MPPRKEIESLINRAITGTLPAEAGDLGVDIHTVENNFCVYQPNAKYWDRIADLYDMWQAGQPIQPHLLKFPIDSSRQPVIVASKQPKFKGGYGSIHLGWDQYHNRPVAIKRIKLPENLSKAEERAEYVKRFFQLYKEGNILAVAEDPHILPVYEILVDSEGNICLILQAVTANEGFVLTNVVSHNRHTLQSRNLSVLPLSSFLDIAQGLAFGSDSLTQKGLTHSDIKPSNVMIRKYQDGFHTVIIDPGIARPIFPQTDGPLVLTPWYSAPERMLSEYIDKEKYDQSILRANASDQQKDAAIHRIRDRDARSELYSVAVTLYELLTGQSLFISEVKVSLEILAEKKELDVRHSHNGALGRVFDRWNLQHAQNKKVKAAREAFIEAFITALAYDPQRRFASPTEFIDVLSNIFSDFSEPYDSKVAEYSRYVKQLDISVHGKIR